MPYKSKYNKNHTAEKINFFYSMCTKYSINVYDKKILESHANVEGSLSLLYKKEKGILTALDIKLRKGKSEDIIKELFYHSVFYYVIDIDAFGFDSLKIFPMSRLMTNYHFITFPIPNKHFLNKYSHHIMEQHFYCKYPSVNQITTYFNCSDFIIIGSMLRMFCMSPLPLSPSS